MASIQDHKPLFAGLHPGRDCGVSPHKRHARTCGAPALASPHPVPYFLTAHIAIVFPASAWSRYGFGKAFRVPESLSTACESVTVSHDDDAVVLTRGRAPFPRRHPPYRTAVQYGGEREASEGRADGDLCRVRTPSQCQIVHRPEVVAAHWSLCVVTVDTPDGGANHHTLACFEHDKGNLGARASLSAHDRHHRHPRPRK